MNPIATASPPEQLWLPTVPRAPASHAEVHTRDKHRFRRGSRSAAHPYVGHDPRRRLAFWLVAFVFAATMLGTTLPTPLYVIYQARFGFSAAVVTVIFAAYAAGVLAALLLAGQSSDRAGRRPVLAVALAASALSTVTFIAAPDVAALLVARVLSGLSAGLMTGTATAALSDLVPQSANRRASLVAGAVNMGGLGAGPLVAGLFAEYASHPTLLVFEVYLVLLGAAALCLAFIPETVSPRRRPIIRFAGLGIPEHGRRQFLSAAIAGFAAFSLLGLFSALAPTFLGDVLKEHSHLVEGAVVFLIFAIAAATQLVFADVNHRLMTLFGLAAFVIGLTFIVTALAYASMPVFLAGTVVGGAAAGAVFMGSLATANQLAPAERRSQSISAFFVACYGGLIVPVIGVGLGSEAVGIFPAVLACAIVLAGLCMFAFATAVRNRT